MSATTATPTTRTVTVPAVVRVGLVLAAVTGLADVVTNASMLADGASSIAGLALGVLTLAAVPFAWRGTRWARLTVAITRLLSGLAGLPAFFVGGVAAGWVIAAAVGLVVEVVIAVLVLRPLRETSGAL